MPRHTKRQIPGQLPMFMPAQELHDMRWADHYGSGPEVPDRVFTYQQKLNESREEGDRHGNGVFEGVRSSGVQTPVSVWHGEFYGGEGDDAKTLLDGHHRVVAQHYLNPNRLIPVEHEARNA